MKKEIINVPSGIKFLSEWNEFKLFDFPYILDKQITGCGFTNYCLVNNQDIILCSPRIMLLENKEKQHKGEVLYARNTLDKVLDVDKDLTKKASGSGKKADLTEEQKKLILENIKNLKKSVVDYVASCKSSNKPCKILVTYDSYRLVRDAILEYGGEYLFNNFYTVVDEMQSVFTDSKFKSSTELSFVNVLQKIKRLCFVSATPMIEKYLDMIDEFKDLPMYCLDWGVNDTERIIKPQLEVHPCQRIVETAVEIVRTYQNHDFKSIFIKDENGELKRIESRELVIYVNSVKNICDIIKKAGLTYENTNVLCANTIENNRKVRRSLGLKRNQVGGIGTVPLKDEINKMFTLCTRTVYLGADFYSNNARTVIMSDANINCLAVDITLDLPQILGRQRLDENPWKNSAELYVKILSENNKVSFQEFKDYQIDKVKTTNNLLKSYTSSPDDSKHDLAKVFKRVTEVDNYKDNYVAVNLHGGADLLPVFNNLVMISELRAFEIQQIDYVDRFVVRNRIEDLKMEVITGDKLDLEVVDFMKGFNNCPKFVNKMKYLHDFLESCGESSPLIYKILNRLPMEYKSYYETLGLERIKALGYQKSKLDNELENKYNSGNDKLKEELYKTFLVGEKYLTSDIKTILEGLYRKYNIKKVAKAIDLFDYFDTKHIQKTNKTTGKREHGYKIINKK